MRHFSGILAVALALGCGPQAAPAKHLPAGAAQDKEGNDVQAVSETHPDDAPGSACISGTPFTDIGPGCKKPVPSLPDASLPIITSEEQLEELLGCKTTMVVDWSKEHVVPVTLEGVNKGWSLMGLCTQGSVTTITIKTTTIMRGAAVFEKDLWLVRIPASSESVVLEWKSAPHEPDGPLYP